MNNQKSYAAAVGQKPLSTPTTPQTFQFNVEQLTKFVANVVIQLAQPQVCYPTAKQDMLDFYQYFYPPEDPDDYRFDVRNEHQLVADVDAQTLIKLVKFLKRGKAPGHDTIHNEVLRLGTTISLFHHLARLFTSSIQLGYIPTAWKLATLRMLLKPDNPPHLLLAIGPSA